MPGRESSVSATNAISPRSLSTGVLKAVNSRPVGPRSPARTTTLTPVRLARKIARRDWVGGPELKHDRFTLVDCAAGERRQNLAGDALPCRASGTRVAGSVTESASRIVLCAVRPTNPTVPAFASIRDPNSVASVPSSLRLD
jgi:hypothetical protein